MTGRRWTAITSCFVYCESGCRDSSIELFPSLREGNSSSMPLDKRLEDITGPPALLGSGQSRLGRGKVLGTRRHQDQGCCSRGQCVDKRPRLLMCKRYTHQISPTCCYPKAAIELTIYERSVNIPVVLSGAIKVGLCLIQCRLKVRSVEKKG